MPELSFIPDSQLEQHLCSTQQLTKSFCINGLISSPQYPRREGVLFPLYRPGHQGSERFIHLLWPGVCTPPLCARASQTWENGRPPASSAAHSLQPSRSGPLGSLPPRMTWHYAVMFQVVLLPTVLWLHKPSLWSSSVATLGPGDLGPRSRAFPAQLVRHLPVSSPHLLAVYISTCLW